MSITYKRAAEVLGMAVSFNGCGRTDSDELKEAVNTAVLVLRQKAVDFQPLSMIELRNMDKQIVYCAELNMDVRVAANKTGWITIHYPLKTEAYCERAHGLTLYRSPKGGTVLSTHGDHIRSMTDGELAILINGNVTCDLCIHGGVCTDPYDMSRCIAGVKAYLGQERKADDGQKA